LRRNQAILVHPSVRKTNFGSRKKVAVLGKAVRLIVTHPHRINIALLTIGRGERNRSAAFLTSLARITPDATKTGIGRPPHFVARRRNPKAETTINARKTNFGSRRRVAVFGKAVRLTTTNLRKRNGALLRIGHGAKNISAAFLTARNTLSQVATMTGNGRPPPSAARGIISSEEVGVGIGNVCRNSKGVPDFYDFILLRVMC